MSDLESVMAYEAGLAHGQAERTRLETRVAELESGIKAALAEIEGGCYADAHSTLSSL